MAIASRVPDGAPGRCPLCNAVVRPGPPLPGADAPCPNCGQLLWFAEGTIQAVLFPAAPTEAVAGRSRLVVRFTDRILSDSETLPALFDKLFRLAEVPVRRDVVLDFQNVQFLSSSVLGKLIVLNRKLQEHRNRLRLGNLCPEVQEVLRLTHLEQLFIVDPGEGLQPAAG